MTGEQLSKAFSLVVVLLTLLVIGELLAGLFGLYGIIATQFLVVLGPTLLFVYSQRIPVREGLRLRRPGASPVVGALIIAPVLALVSSILFRLQEVVIPLPGLEREGFARLAEEATRNPGLGLFALALVPAVSEELLFRGLVLGALERRYGARRGILLSALAFALFHRSIYRFFAQAVLGVVLGAQAVRSRSIVPSVVTHFLYNFAILVAGGALLRLAESVLVAAFVTLLAAAAIGWFCVTERFEATLQQRGDSLPL